MRAGFEFNAGRYWEEARRVNFQPRERSLPAEQLESRALEDMASSDAQVRRY
jgi:hypothetical protein